MPRDPQSGRQAASEPAGGTGEKDPHGAAIARDKAAGLFRAGAARARGETDLGTAIASTVVTYARHDALDYRVVEPELGFLLVRAADFATAKRFGADVRRTQTLMQGVDAAIFGTAGGQAG